jgi:DNA polymerase III alpha subunit
MSTGLRGFTHLQVHSHFTLLGGTAPVEALAARAAAEGMTHLALTDTNALYGAVSFSRACRQAGVSPIVGMTVTVAPPGERLGAESSPGHLVLLATGPAGYRSLCRLSSIIQADPQREALAARGLSWEELAAHREGLICLGGGRAGWVERLLRAGDREAAARYAARRHLPTGCPCDTYRLGHRAWGGRRRPWSCLLPIRGRSRSRIASWLLSPSR